MDSAASERRSAERSVEIRDLRSNGETAGGVVRVGLMDVTFPAASSSAPSGRNRTACPIWMRWASAAGTCRIATSRRVSATTKSVRAESTRSPGTTSVDKRIPSCGLTTGSKFADPPSAMPAGSPNRRIRSARRSGSAFSLSAGDGPNRKLTSLFGCRHPNFGVPPRRLGVAPPLFGRRSPRPFDVLQRVLFEFRLHDVRIHSAFSRPTSVESMTASSVPALTASPRFAVTCVAVPAVRPAIRATRLGSSCNSPGALTASVRSAVHTGSTAIPQRSADSADSSVSRVEPRSDSGGRGFSGVVRFVVFFGAAPEISATDGEQSGHTDNPWRAHSRVPFSRPA